MKWFQHSSTLRNDAKVKRLIKRYGSDGYCIYVSVVEMIADILDPVKQIIPYLDTSLVDIAEDFGIDSTRVKQIMDYCVNQGLFEFSTTGHYFCFKLYLYVDQYFTRVKGGQQKYAERNRKIITAYRDNGLKAMLQCIKELSPHTVDFIGQIELATDQLPTNYRVSTDLVPLEENTIEYNRTKENIKDPSQTEDSHFPKEDDDITIFDDVFPDAQQEKPKRYNHPEQMIQRIIHYSAKLKSLPTEKRMLLNIAESGKILDSLSYHTLEEIKQAYDNYEKIYLDRENYNFMPYQSCISFLINGISKYTDEANPFELLRKTNVNKTPEMTEDEYEKLLEQAGEK